MALDLCEEYLQEINRLINKRSKKGERPLPSYKCCQQQFKKNLESGSKPRDLKSLETRGSMVSVHNEQALINLLGQDTFKQKTFLDCLQVKKLNIK